MEPLNITLITTFSALLATLNGDSTTQTNKSNTYILPKIAGQWQAILDDDKEISVDDILAKDDIFVNRSSGFDTDKIVANKSYSSTKGCREFYTFDKDNQMRTSSGAEITHGQYVVINQAKGLPLLMMTTIYDNNEVDCGGNQVDQTGEQVFAYIKEEGNSMQWCIDKQGVQCTMRFKRVLP